VTLGAYRLALVEKVESLGACGGKKRIMPLSEGTFLSRG
jgi:hypothetical protein